VADPRRRLAAGAVTVSLNRPRDPGTARLKRGLVERFDLARRLAGRLRQDLLLVLGSQMRRKQAQPGQVHLS